MNIKELVQGKYAHFTHYQKGFLWYVIYMAEQGQPHFSFPVPIEDTGDGKFHTEDKAIFFMRWIRKHLDNIEEGKNGL